LGKLNTIVKDFVKYVSLKHHLPESVANEAGGKIFTFGSYRLGVHGAGADIDTLCVTPKHIQREDFFEDMYEALKKRPEVTNLTLRFFFFIFFFYFLFFIFYFILFYFNLLLIYIIYNFK